MIRILIADDHSLIRRIVREIIEHESDMQVVAEARDGHEAEAQAAETQPDVVLMDLALPDYDGFEATERVLACSPGSHVVMLTASQQEHLAFRAIQRGAIGYLTKDIEPEALVAAIRCAARNEMCIPGPLATRVLAHLRMLTLNSALYGSGPGYDAQISPSSPLSAMHYNAQPYPGPCLNGHGSARHLTERENEVLDLIRKGRKNREIARELRIAESTVHKHIQNIFEKLHARSRTEAIYLMSNRGA
ncbi:MAG: response regulator transcription factor [Chloroflexota bacterium]|nr:response regulator transcription factor [Chloroflexota bacterium]